MNTSLALNSLLCTCDTDKNAKLDINELGTTKCETVQSWVLNQILQPMQFTFLDGNNDGFIDVPEFNQALAAFGYATTTHLTTTSTMTSSMNTTSSTMMPMNTTSSISNPTTTMSTITTNFNSTLSSTTHVSTTSTNATSTTPNTSISESTTSSGTSSNGTPSTAAHITSTTSTPYPCGGDIYGPSGTITSPGWPNGYPKNQSINCVWNITCSGPTEFAQIVFQRFSLEACE